MKIYIQNLKISKPISLDKLKNLDTNIRVYKEIYSYEGIYRIENNSICKFFICNDMPSDLIEYKNINLIIDKSKYIFRKERFHIPYNHILNNLTEFEYRLNNKSSISLIIIINTIDTSIKDLYFYTNENILDTNLKNDIHTFLLLLNNIY